MLAMMAVWRYWLGSSEGGGSNRVLAHCVVIILGQSPTQSPPGNEFHRYYSSCYSTATTVASRIHKTGVASDGDNDDDGKRMKYDCMQPRHIIHLLANKQAEICCCRNYCCCYHCHRLSLLAVFIAFKSLFR